MIPRIIHYTWFGGAEKPKRVKQQIESWKFKLPDYHFIEWNESNYDISTINSKYVQEAYEKQMWAFVTDYVRLDVLRQYGGIYLDTDVQVIKSFDSLLEQGSFIGKESEYTLCTAVIGAEPNSKWLIDLLLDYDKRSFKRKDGGVDKTPNSKYLLQFFGISSSSQVNNFSKIEGVKFYPFDFFSPINFATGEKKITNNTYAIHHYSGTWKNKRGKSKDFILRVITRLIGEKKVERLKRYLHK
ncbi:glycosyltransferase family 32 protein [Ligilactobacillus acidipiscis]|uniref:glycosyltransferase family 32 protein n=1 Tax=Ligilactobacillus acidipiscis TaxID=89059 RepID=UPI0022DF14E8|nr:glycosyltransferase [Ligilactobacillus acidipiscis]